MKQKTCPGNQDIVLQFLAFNALLYHAMPSNAFNGL